MRLRKAVLLASAIWALGAGSAQAALPEYSGTLPDSATVHSGKVKFENAGSKLEVECSSGEGSLTVEAAKVAKFDELFLGCEAILSHMKIGKCTGLTDTTTGSILAKGTSTLGYSLKEALVPVVALTLSEVHFECPLGTLVIVRGCLVGTTTLFKSLTATLKFEALLGQQLLGDYTSDTGTGVRCELESSVNGGTFGMAALVQTASVTFAKEVGVLD
jgi:hypothetical protein